MIHPVLVNLEERNRKAQQTIQGSALDHAAMDVAIGFGGFLPIPFAGTASIGAALMAQGPIYRGLAKSLSGIYEADLSGGVQRIVKNGAVVDTLATVGADLSGKYLGKAIDWDSLLGSSFFHEILPTLIGETSLGAFIAAIPILGGLAALGIDAAIGATMTWRVGTMVSLFYQNGMNWPQGDRAKAYGIAKTITGPLSPQIDGRVAVNTLRNRVSDILHFQISDVARYIRKLLQAMPSASDSQILRALERYGLPLDIAMAALERVRRGGTDFELN